MSNNKSCLVFHNPVRGVSALSVRSFVRELPASVSVAAAEVSGGQPRNVDLQKIRTMIQENKLSDHNAEYYKKAD
jgi:hypothetical protein